MKSLALLGDLKPGQTAIICENTAAGDHGRRLKDLGFADGSSVECLMRSPLGDPTAYRIREAVIALRRKDANRIYVKRTEAEPWRARHA